VIYTSVWLLEMGSELKVTSDRNPRGRSFRREGDPQSLGRGLQNGDGQSPRGAERSESQIPSYR